MKTKLIAFSIMANARYNKFLSTSDDRHSLMEDVLDNVREQLKMQVENYKRMGRVDADGGRSPCAIPRRTIPEYPDERCRDRGPEEAPAEDRRGKALSMGLHQG